MAAKLSQGIVELKKDEVMKEVTERAEKGEDPIKILEECREGMTIVGDKFQEGDFFLAELMLSAEIFKSAFTVLKPFLSKAGPQKKIAKVMLVTLKGDIHDLGKNLFADLLDSQGFDVYDLGVDAAPGVVVDKVKEVKPEFLGFSALMTTSFKVMEETASMLENEGLRDNIILMVGGGVTTPAVAEHVRADFQTVDAMDGVDFCKKNAIGGK
jgi:5-methyltetrahydrofolate--homocysteine methyltransferase